MAMTAVQRMQKKKERDQRLLRNSEDGARALLGIPFHESAELGANYSNVELALALIGIEAPVFVDDRDPTDSALSEAIDGVEDTFAGAKGAIGRAEVMVDCLIDAASEMSAIVNAYKQRELKARLNELAQDETIDRAQAISDATTINKKLDQLDKQVRRSFPQWRVTGQ